MEKQKALLIVDVQNDFCPGGKLPVKKCQHVVGNFNKYIKEFKNKNLPIIATRDWHPKDSQHFEKFGGKWPPHCIQNTKGANFHPGLELPENVIIISEGIKPNEEGYSCFEGYDENQKKFNDVLKTIGIKELYIGGIATDYCVKIACLDSIKYGYKVYLLTDAIEGIEVNPGDVDKAIKEMEKAGVKKINFHNLNL